MRFASRWFDIAQWTPLHRQVRRVFAFAVALGIASAVFVPIIAQAQTDTQTKFAEVIASILSLFVFALGKLLLGVIAILMWVAQYNNFLNSAAIANGWVIIRDVANMFFIVVLLIAAFGTILGQSSYSWKAMLPQLVVGAILINFSRTIAGIAIDVSQVLMLTFVNGFSAAAGGNFAGLFQIQKLLTLNATSFNPVDAWDVLGGYFLAILLLIVSLITTGVMTVILAFRIVMLWILVTLSPLPYLLNIFSAGKKYASRWWEEFSKYLIVGPVLAFFLWLALVSIGTGNVASEFEGQGLNAADRAEFENNVRLVPTQAGSLDAMLSFVIGIAFLIGGLKVAGETGAAGAGAATGAVSWMQKKGVGAVKRVTGVKYAEALLKLREQRKEEKFKGRVAKVAGAVDLATGTVRGGLSAARGAVTGLNRQFSKKVGLSGETLGESVSAKFGTWRTGKREDLEKDRADRAKRIAGGTASFWDYVRQDAMVGWQKHGAERSSLNVAQDQRVEQRVKAMQAQGLSREQITATLESNVSTDDEKIAAAVLLAMREGFREGDAGRAQVTKAKSLMAGNAPLGKRFGDEIDKRLAHLQFDFSEKNPKREEDIKKFIAKMDKGDVDFRKLRSDAARDPALLRALSGRYATPQFRSLTEDFSKRSLDHKKAISEGLKSAFKDEVIVDGKLDPMRSAYAAVSGDVVTAASEAEKDASGAPVLGADGKPVQRLNEGQLNQMIRLAPADLIAKINVDQINSNPKLREAIARNVSIGALKGLARTGEMRHLDAIAPQTYGSRDDEFKRRMWKDDVLGEIVRDAGLPAPPPKPKGPRGGPAPAGGAPAGGGPGSPVGGAGPP